jgi:hypothetical protein
VMTTITGTSTAATAMTQRRRTRIDERSGAKSEPHQIITVMQHDLGTSIRPVHAQTKGRWMAANRATRLSCSISCRSCNSSACDKRFEIATSETS